MRLYVYILRRLAFLVFILVALSIIVFYLGRGLLPPTASLAPYINPNVPAFNKLAIAQEVGVATKACPSWDALTSRVPTCIVPLYIQYFSWLKNVASGNWGFSVIPGIGAGETTWALFATRFPITVQLALSAAFLTILIGIPLGIVSATNKNKLPDHISRIIALTGYSTPIFWLGYLLQLVFVLYVTINGAGILPTSGVVSQTCGLCVPNPGTITSYTGMPVLDSLLSGNLAYFRDSFLALILPAVTLSFATLGWLTRIVRSSMIEVLKQDYVIQARSKGLRERTIIYRHALKNAMLPAITVSGLLIAFLLGGVVIIEYVFNIPGVGYAVLQAGLYLDINFLELYVLVDAIIIVVANLGVDVIYALIDPRIRY